MKTDYQKRLMSPLAMIHLCLWSLIGLLFVLIIVVPFFGIPYEYSSGERTGVITKVSQKGVIFKTWEGQMNMGGFTSGGDDGTLAPNIWSFSVNSKELLPFIKDAARSGKRITLTYKQPLIMSYRDGSSFSLITGIEVKK